MGMLLDSEIHNEISSDIFKDNYLRINSPLGKINRFLDDDSEENLERIHLMGMELKFQINMMTYIRLVIQRYHLIFR